MKYQIALLKDGGTTAYGSTAIFAADNSEAMDKAKIWMASFHPVAADAWLQINLNGVSIRSLRPGEF
jgi:hypothetical protein